ncbi:MAG: IS256 family transposase [Steroidobacteraceae bacterium]
MGEDTVVRLGKPSAARDALTELLRDGARRLLQQAVQAELEEFLAPRAGECEEQGRAGVVRNGYLPERAVLTGIGPVAVRVPKVRSRTEEAVVFRSSLVPPYVRKAKSIEAALPWLYLRGISTGQMQEALRVLVGEEAHGLSAPVVSRLKMKWQEDYRRWSERRLDADRWVYWWVDGIYSGLRGESERLCALVVMGVNERGQKRFLAIEDGVRESTQSWREVLLKLKARGVETAPELAVGDGALGFWAALEEIYPHTRAQRCWKHKAANVLNYLPKSVQGKAKEALHEIWMAATRESAELAFDRFLATYQGKYPKATECLQKDRAALLAFYDFPAEHWVHVRTTNPIESAFATIRHRSDRAKGCVTRATMLALVFKLALAAEQGFRKLRGFAYLAKIIAGVRFVDGVEKIEGRELSRAAA